MIERHLSWRELALVACALLVPIPVLAASGLGIPLPSVVERAAASLLPLSGSSEPSVPTLESGTSVTTVGPTGGQPTTDGRAAVPDSDVAKPSRAGSVSHTGTSSIVTTTTSGGGGEGADDAPPPTDREEESPPPEDPAPVPLPDPDDPAADAAAAVSAPPSEPIVEVEVAGPAVSVDASVGEDVSVSVDVGGEEGPPDVGVTLPGVGIP